MNAIRDQRMKSEESEAFSFVQTMGESMDIGVYTLGNGCEITEKIVPTIINTLSFRINEDNTFSKFSQLRPLAIVFIASTQLVCCLS